MRAYVVLYYMGMNPLFFLQLCFPMPITWFLICDYLYCNFVAAGLFSSFLTRKLCSRRFFGLRGAKTTLEFGMLSGNFSFPLISVTLGAIMLQAPILLKRLVR
jgi:hypothetical protein